MKIFRWIDACFQTPVQRHAWTGIVFFGIALWQFVLTFRLSLALCGLQSPSALLELYASLEQYEGIWLVDFVLGLVQNTAANWKTMLLVLFESVSKWQIVLLISLVLQGWKGRENRPVRWVCVLFVLIAAAAFTAASFGLQAGSLGTVASILRLMGLFLAVAGGLGIVICLWAVGRKLSKIVYGA